MCTAMLFWVRTVIGVFAPSRVLTTLLPSSVASSQCLMSHMAWKAAAQHYLYHNCKVSLSIVRQEQRGGHQASTLSAYAS